MILKLSIRWRNTFCIKFPHFSRIFDWYSIDYNTEGSASLTNRRNRHTLSHLFAFTRNFLTFLPSFSFFFSPSSLFLNFSNFERVPTTIESSCDFTIGTTPAHTEIVKIGVFVKLLHNDRNVFSTDTKLYYTEIHTGKLIAFSFEFSSQLFRPTFPHSSLLNVCFALIKSSSHWKSIQSTDVEAE